MAYGTPSCMAPEVVEAYRLVVSRVDPEDPSMPTCDPAKIDIWAAGVLLLLFLNLTETPFGDFDGNDPYPDFSVMEESQACWVCLCYLLPALACYPYLAKYLKW